jgi:copper chaperone CopZ
MSIRTMLTGLACVLALAVPARAHTHAELKHVHVCCEGCAEEVADILSKVEGVQDVKVDQKANTAKFTVADAKAAQKAVDALAAGGFHGDTGTKEFSFKNDSGVVKGKVKSLTVTGFHNSCGGCVKSLLEAIKPVAGVAGNNAKAKVTTCEFTGDFDAAALVEALNKGGFHVQVKQ